MTKHRDTDPQHDEDDFTHARKLKARTRREQARRRVKATRMRERKEPLTNPR